MPSVYRGIPGNTSGNFAGALTISSSTNTSPIQITTSAPHGLITGDVVNVYGHQTNTNANGQFTVTVTGANTFTLNGSTTSGSAGGATGNVQPLTAPSFNQPSDGDALNASSANVPFDALADRSAWIYTEVGSYKWRVGGGAPNDGAIQNEDAFVGGTWGNLNIASTNTRTGATGSTIPWQVANDAIAGDIIDLQLDFTITWGGGASPGNGLFLFLEYATQQPGGSLSSYSKVHASAKWIEPPSIGSTQYIPCTLHAWQGIGAASSIVWVRPSGFVPTGGGTGQVNFYSDYFLTCRHWRASGAPQ